MATPIVLVSSPKGGVGKSTIVKNMAVCAAQAHLRVLAVDLDPQRTLALWGERRPRTEVVQVEVLPSTYDEWSQSKRRFSAASYDLVIVDTPPGVEHDVEVVKIVARDSKLVLLPTGPTSVDLDSVLPWANGLKAARISPTFLLNKTDRRRKSFRTAQRALLEVAPLAPVEIPSYEDIHIFDARGLTPLDIAKGAGTSDLETLWAFLRGQING